MGEILKSKPDTVFTISQFANIDQAIVHLTEQKISSALAVDDKNEVTGIFTARDILRFLNKSISAHTHSTAEKIRSESRIQEIMVKRDQMVFCSPVDTVRKCREIMFQLKIRNIPVIDKGECLGIITIKDLADSAFSVTDTGGKKSFIHNISQRKGLAEGVKVNAHTIKAAAEKSLGGAGAGAGSSGGGEGGGDMSSGLSSWAKGGGVSAKIDVDIASFSMPHPFKQAQGVAHNRRQFGPDELCTDDSLCEGMRLNIKNKYSLSFC